MRLVWKILLALVGVLVLLVATVVIAFTVSVKPGVYVIGKMFEQPVTILEEESFERVNAKVELQEDITYTSEFNENELDIYYPKDSERKGHPILFWVHGGAFVSGDKEALREFATHIAADNGVSVVALNYDHAPDLKYPGQVKQLAEVYSFLEENAEDYPMLDFSKVMFGGDSAGAQIAGQYVALQTNDSYAKDMGIDQIVAKDSLRGFLSYSGPVDMEQMTTMESSSFFMKFFTNTVARAFIGVRDWKNSDEIREASVRSYVTEDFPATYITDGNTFSFQEQGMALRDELSNLDIDVVSLFFDQMDKEISHEYQFNYSLDEARESLQQTKDFIENQLENN